MISEDLWRLIKKWSWLVGLTAIAGVALAIALIPMMSGASSEYHSSITLGIRRVVSPGSPGETVDADLLADYTTSVAGRAKTPQFVAKLHDSLTTRGVVVPESALAGTYDVVDDRGLSRITIDSTAGNEATAAAIAQGVADLIVAEIAAEEVRLRASLQEGLDTERDDLLLRLGEVSSARLARLQALGDAELQATIDNVVRRGIGTNLPEEAREILAELAQLTGDPELAILASREVAIHDELARVASIEQSLSGGVRGDPVFVLLPVDTAQTETLGTSRRDAGMLGLLAGALLGWVIANIAERNNWRLPRLWEAAKPTEHEAEQAISRVSTLRPLSEPSEGLLPEVKEMVSDSETDIASGSPWIWPTPERSSGKRKSPKVSS